MFDYPAIRAGLFGVVERLGDTVRNETAKSLNSIRTRLQEETFNLVILGQFKRGKSTLINALLGEDILPTAIVPLTSIVTVLRYGPELRVEVQYLDERREDISLSALPTFITERENPQNIKAVKEVTIFYPSRYLKDGVRIIDTPGAGSIYNHNTEVAYNFLPYVDAAIFVVSADPPISMSEHQFLKDVRDYVDKFFFVLNKIDQVNGQDRQEALEFTLRILEDDLGKGRVKIYPLAARWALEGKKACDNDLLERSLLPDFEKELQAFFVHEKGRVFLKSIANSLMKLASDETISFQIEQEATKLPLEILKEKIARFEEEMKHITKDREDNQYLLKGNLTKIITRLDEEIDRFKKEALPVLQRDLEEEYIKMTQRKNSNLRHELEQFIFHMIQVIFNTWRDGVTKDISSLLEEIHYTFAMKINETIDRIITLTSDIFAIQLTAFKSVETLNKKSDFYFLLKDDPVGLELIQLAVTSALPQFVARKIILKNMKASVTDLVDRHCGRVRYDLINRITKTVKEFQNALNEKIDLTIEGINISFHKALSIHQSGKADLEKSLGRLSARLGSIGSIREELESYVGLLKD